MSTKSKQTRPKKAAWKTETYDSALLFLLLHKRIIDHPDDFSAYEIQQNPLFNFDKYSSHTFNRNSQTVANKVKKFEEKGTGLIQEFKNFCFEVLNNHKDLFASPEEDPPPLCQTPSGGAKYQTWNLWQVKPYKD
jgi:hypothetical protein